MLILKTIIYLVLKIYLVSASSQSKTNNNDALTNSLKRIKLKKQLVIESDSRSRIDLLNEFLTLKIYENIDKMHIIAIPQIRITFQDVIPILEDLTYLKTGMSLVKLGTTECSLENVALQNVNKSVSVCPWHWEVLQRQDRYPFKLPVAKCNCDKCQAKTIYDSDEYKLSACRQEISFQPALYRTHHVNKTEKWSFAFEAVPLACVCAIKLNPL